MNIPKKVLDFDLRSLKIGHYLLFKTKGRGPLRKNTKYILRIVRAPHILHHRD